MNKLKLYTVAALLLLTAFGVQSCKKDTSNPPPRITITKPADRTYLVDHQIPVSVSLYDEGGLKDLIITVTDYKFANPIDSIYIPINSVSEFIADTSFSVSSVTYPIGTKGIINVIATDIDNNTKKVSVVFNTSN